MKSVFKFLAILAFVATLIFSMTAAKCGIGDVIGGIKSIGGGGSGGSAGETTSSSGIVMVSIRGGKFMMGSPESEPGRRIDEGPQHSVTLSGFKMGKYQVTQAQWVAVMGASKDQAKEKYGKGDNYPVYNVSWYDALVFCNKLSDMEGLSPAYRINGTTDPTAWGTVPTSVNSTWDAVEVVSGSTGYRLPTEAQWEYACRAGTTTAYNTGDTFTDNTGWGSNSGGKTHQVGLKEANAWGLYDMHGNVSEWCWDWYDSGYYSNSPANDPMGSSSGINRVVRGGGWYGSVEWLRSATRGNATIYFRGISIGIRLVRP